MADEQVQKTPADAESFEEFKTLRAPAPEPAKVEEKPVEEKPSEAAVETPAAETAAPTEAAEPSTQEQERKRRDRSAEGRIAELTAARHEAEEEAAELRRKLGEMQVSKPASEIAPSDAKPLAENDPDPKPKLKTYLEKDDLSYEDAQEKWEDDVAEWRERKRQRTSRESQVRETVTSRLAAARAEFQDFDEVTYGNPQTGQGLILTKPMQEYAVDSDGAMRVFYHLGKNPEAYRSIATLSPIRQIAELAKLEASLGSNGHANAQAPEKPKPPVSRAPAPPRIVGGVETSVRTDTSEASTMEEHRRIRRAKLGR